jgi:hypothetical protein
MKVTTAVLVGLQSLCLDLAGANPVARRAATQDASMTLQDGSVKGFVDTYGNSVFLGIPFAETTGGENRYFDSNCHMHVL